MNLSSELESRCGSVCELCGSTESINAYLVPPKTEEVVENQVALCSQCMTQVEDSEQMEENHWRCLNESMWSEVPAVKVMAYRMLQKLQTSSWAQDLINMIYLDEATLEWAQAGADISSIIHKDSNGHILENGDTVVLIKDLNVKGANFTAKRGTAVRRIRLVHDNEGQIEGKVDGQQIVILTQFVKKS